MRDLTEKGYVRVELCGESTGVARGETIRPKFDVLSTPKKLQLVPCIACLNKTIPKPAIARFSLESYVLLQLYLVLELFNPDQDYRARPDQEGLRKGRALECWPWNSGALSSPRSNSCCLGVDFVVPVILFLHGLCRTLRGPDRLADEKENKMNFTFVLPTHKHY